MSVHQKWGCAMSILLLVLGFLLVLVVENLPFIIAVAFVALLFRFVVNWTYEHLADDGRE